MLKTLFRDSLIYGASDAIIKFVSFFTFPLVVSLLSVAEYGSLDLVSNFMSIIGMVMNVGIYNSVQRFYFESNYCKKELISTSFFELIIVSCFVALVCFVVFSLYGKFFINLFGVDVRVLLVAVLVCVTLQIIGFSKNILRLYFSPFRFLALTIFSSVFSLLLALLFLYKGQGIFGYFLAQLVVGLIFIPVSIIQFYKDFHIRFNIKVFKDVFSYGAPFIIAGLGYWLISATDKWMLRHYSGFESVGIYSVAMKFSTLLYFIQTAFAQAWSPLALKQYNEDKENYKKMFSDVFNIFYAVMVLLGACLIFLVPDFITIFLPVSYQLSVISSILLIGGVVLNATTQITLIGISLAKKTHLMSISVWLCVGMNVILNFILIPPLKQNGASLASLATYFLLSLLYLVYSQKVHYIPYNYKKLLIITIVMFATMLVGVCFALKEYSQINILIKFAVLLIEVFIFSSLKILDVKKLLHTIRGSK